ncbi:MAG: cytochrome b/b6 domain-containing protein [Planktomarina sp.]
MTVTNTATHFGWVTKTFHWLTALLIISAIALGVTANRWGFETGEALTQKAWLFSFHKTVGITAFFVAVLRIIWALTQPKPAGLASHGRAESLLAKIVHWTLYCSMVLVPLAGWVTHASSEGFAPIRWPFGQNLPLVPKSDALHHTAAMLHVFWERVLIISILLHIAGAVKHHVIDKDATLRRMLPGRSPDVDLKPATSSLLPPVLAGVIFAVVAIAAGATSYIKAADRPATLLKPSIAGDWSVVDGSLSIIVRQFGNDVNGTFENWTTDITFDETIEEGTAGTVTGQIAINSLTLGSVTDQAMGPDYFDAGGFPVALFDAVIEQSTKGTELAGNLTLKGVDQPFAMPFDLQIEGDTATASGGTTLHRLDFGIGTVQPDEGTLGFEVLVTVELTATRSQ